LCLEKSTGIHRPSNVTQLTETMFETSTVQFKSYHKGLALKIMIFTGSLARSRSLG
jgi:hypothetical protein